MTTGRKINYAYDNNGNQAERTLPNGTDKTWTQSWDYENRLIKLEKIKGSERKTVMFKYDPFGRRIEKEIETVKGGVIKTQTYTYVYDNEDIVQETFIKADSTTETTYYTHGPGIDEPLAMERNGAYYYYHADGLGSITAITNASKAVVQSYTYDSFGVPKPSTSFRNAYTFTSREWDSETGMYFYRARYYDPMAGRFISKDPIGFAGGDMNLYGYVWNKPMDLIDPYGNCPWCLVGAGFGAGLNMYAQLSTNGGNWSQIKVQQVGLSAAAGFLGGGLGSATASLSLGWNVTANTLGSGLIGAGITASQNALNPCNQQSIWANTWKSAAFAGVGASSGNLWTVGAKGLSNMRSNAAWSNMTLQQRLFTSTNALHGPYYPGGTPATIGTILGNAWSNFIANLNQ